MENRTEPQIEWFEQVFETAKDALLSFNLSAIYEVVSYNPISPAFWERLPLVPDYRPNYQAGGRSNAGFFSSNATTDDKTRFVENQILACRKVNEEILAIEDNVITRLQEIECKYALKKTSRVPDKAMLHIATHSDDFDSNPALHFLTRLKQIVFNLVDEKKYIESKKDLDMFLTAHLREQCGIDLLGGSVGHLTSGFYDTIRTELEDVFSKRREGAPVLIKLGEIKSWDIKTSIGIGAHFAEETTRGSGRRTPAEGGRAGLGAAKPDLWKPETP
jgi:hypothetical protein